MCDLWNFLFRHASTMLLSGGDISGVKRDRLSYLMLDQALSSFLNHQKQSSQSCHLSFHRFLQ